MKGIIPKVLCDGYISVISLPLAKLILSLVRSAPPYGFPFVDACNETDHDPDDVIAMAHIHTSTLPVRHFDSLWVKQGVTR
jgi:hypothetical protein